MAVQPTFTSDLDISELPYVPISPAAVVALILGLLSVLCLAHAAFFVLPLMGTLVGLWALLKIRRSAGQLGGGWLALSGLVLSASFLSIGGSVRAYQATHEVEPGYTVIHYDLFRTYHGGPALPPELAALNGKKVHLRGFMVPIRETAGLKRFILTRDNKTCCFGAQRALTDMVDTRMAGEQTTDFHSDVSAVGGTLHVGAERQGGEVVSLYQLDADYVK